jgi:hypothetical protein
VRHFLLFLFTALVCQINLAQQPYIKLNQKTETVNEICISVNPVNPELMAAGTNINWLYLSNDHGKTWKETQMQSPLGIWGDPVLLHDDSGYLYYAHLSRTHGKDFPDNIDRIVVQRSTDGGLTFTDGTGVGANGQKAQDKEWMSFDGSVTSRFYGNLYLSWTEFDRYGSKLPQYRSRIRFSRSTDRGLTFSTPVIVSDSSGDCIDGDNTTEGATTTTTPDGSIIIAWAAFGKIFTDRSEDGGITFGKDQAVTEQINGWDMDIKHIYRSNGMPFLASDLCSTSPVKGRIYLCWADERQGDADVWLMYSDTKGQSWSKPIRVNQDSTGNGKSQFMPHLCVDQSTGKVYIIYYDNRHSREAFLDTYVAVSSDGGVSFQEIRLTNSFPAAGKRVFFGDYITVSAAKGIVRAAWTATGENGPEARVASVDQFNSSALRHPAISLPFYNETDRSLTIHVSTGRQASGTVQVIVNGLAQSPVEVAEEDELVLRKPEKGNYLIRLLSHSRQVLAERSFIIAR